MSSDSACVCDCVCIMRGVYSDSLSAEDAAAAAVAVGSRVKRVLGCAIKIEFDDNKGIKVSKEIVEETLECDLEASRCASRSAPR